MVKFIFRCPITGVQVQGWTADDDAENGKETYEGQHCPVCNRLHFVDPTRGVVLGVEEE